MVQKHNFSARILGVLLGLMSGLSGAEEIQLQHKGLTLNGELVLAEGQQISDGVVLITHGTLAHNQMEIIATLQELLVDSDLNVLAINLSLGVSDRHGMYDCSVPHTHRHTDAIEEMGVWLDWLEQQGASRVDVVGHSRGGNQVAWLAAEQDRPSIGKVVLIAPATWSEKKSVDGYQKRYETPLAPVYQQAEALVKAGNGEQMMGPIGFIYCADSQATADAFLAYYRPDPRRDTPYLLPQISKPLLLVEGSEDNVVGRIAKDGEAPGGDNIESLMIDGAGHFFRDLYLEDVAEQMVEWLQG